MPETALRMLEKLVSSCDAGTLPLCVLNTFGMTKLIDDIYEVCHSRVAVISNSTACSRYGASVPATVQPRYRPAWLAVARVSRSPCESHVIAPVPTKVMTAPARPVKTSELLIVRFAVTRSEEHTSELHSHHDLVCRLLLEKKKE